MLIETPSEAATERRRRWIEKRSQALQAGQSIDQLPQEGEEPVRTYDPKIVSWENVAWLYKAYCLGFNPKAAKGKGKSVDDRFSVDQGELSDCFKGHLSLDRVIMQTRYASWPRLYSPFSILTNLAGRDCHQVWNGRCTGSRPECLHLV
jgi:hypothetical protein